MKYRLKKKKKKNMRNFNIKYLLIWIVDLNSIILSSIYYQLFQLILFKLFLPFFFFFFFLIFQKK